MDLLKWIKSLDEALFELMSWLVFWPVTLARALLQPIVMMRYADAQLARPEDEQYDEALSPPVFLVLTLVVAHLVAVALGQPDVLVENQRGMAAMVTSEALALGVRLGLFASFPLVFSALLLLAKRRKLKRASLQLPFYAQCYPAAAFAAVLSIAAQVSLLRIGPDGLAGLAILGCIAWLAVVEGLWFRREHGFSRAAAAGLSLTGMAIGMTLVGVLILLLSAGS